MVHVSCNIARAQCSILDLGLRPIVKAIQLVEKLQHGALNLGVTSAAALQARRPDRINLVHEAARGKSWGWGRGCGGEVAVGVEVVGIVMEVLVDRKWR